MAVWDPHIIYCRIGYCVCAALFVIVLVLVIISNPIFSMGQTGEEWIRFFIIGILLFTISTITGIGAFWYAITVKDSVIEYYDEINPQWMVGWSCILCMVNSILIFFTSIYAFTYSCKMCRAFYGAKFIKCGSCKQKISRTRSCLKPLSLGNKQGWRTVKILGVTR